MTREVIAWTGLLAAGLLAATSPSHAGNPNAVRPSDYADTPAARYASLPTAACLKELADRQIPHTVAAATPGVDAPVRITGPLHGVKMTLVNRAADEALNADGAITDCRLALSLHDLAAKLQSRKVVELGYISAYRRADADADAARPGERHPAGLAIDVAWMRMDNGRELNVVKDFHGRVGARTCGTRAEPPRQRTDAARQLREIVCEAAAGRLFNLVLTPNYNREHHNHLHLEVRRNIDWILVQ